MERRVAAEMIPLLNEGVALVLRGWPPLGMAVDNQWGGPHSRLKAQQLATDLLSWFIQTKEPLYIDDLEDMLHEGMLSLNVGVQDGSIEVVAEQLMIMHEQFLEGNFKSIEILREASLKQAACPPAIQMQGNDEDDDDDDDDDNDNGGGENKVNADDNSCKMMMDMPNPAESNFKSMDVQFKESISKAVDEADDGWIQVSNKRNKGRRN